VHSPSLGLQFAPSHNSSQHVLADKNTIDDFALDLVVIVRRDPSSPAVFGVRGRGGPQHAVDFDLLFAA